MAALFNILVDIAARTANFETGMKRVEDKLSTFERNVSKSTATLLRFAGLGAPAVVLANFARNSLIAADAAGDAADRLGILASEYSQLSQAAAQADVSNEALNSGLRNIQKALSEAANGSESARQKFKDLGLEAADLKGLGIDAKLSLISRAFRDIQDPADRTRIAMELFGKSGQEIIPFLLEFDQKMAAVASTLDDRAVKAIDRGQKALDRLFTRLKNFTANDIGGFLADVFGSGDELLDAQAQLDKLLDQRELLLQSTGGDANVPGIVALEKEIRLQRQVVDELLRRQEVESKASDFAAMAAQMRSQQITALDQQLESSFQAFLERQKVEEKAAKDRIKYLEDVDTATQEARREIDEYYQNLDELTKTADEKFVEGAMQKYAALEVLMQKDERNYALYLKRKEELDKEYLSEVQVTAQKMVVDNKSKTDEISEYWRSAQRNMQSAFADFLYDPFKDGLDGMLKSFINTLRRMAAEAASAMIFEKLFGANGKSGAIGDDIISFLGGLFGGGRSPAPAGGSGFSGPRAMGGPVSAGMTYLVGERGPELFTPKSSGNISPNDKLGMTFAPKTSIYIGAGNNVTPAQVKAAVAEGNRELLRHISESTRRGR